MLRIVDDTPGSIEEFLTLDNWSRAAVGALQEGATHLVFEVAQSATQLRSALGLAQASMLRNGDCPA